MFYRFLNQTRINICGKCFTFNFRHSPYTELHSKAYHSTAIQYTVIEEQTFTKFYCLNLSMITA